MSSVLHRRLSWWRRSSHWHLVWAGMSLLMACATEDQCPSELRSKAIGLQQRRAVAADVVWAFRPDHCLTCGEPAWLLRELRKRYGDRITIRLVTTGEDRAYVRRFAREARLDVVPELVTPAVLNRCFGLGKDARLLVVREAAIVLSRVFPEGGEDRRLVLGQAMVTIDSLAAINGQPAEAPTLDTVGRTPISAHAQ